MYSFPSPQKSNSYYMLKPGGPNKPPHIYVVLAVGVYFFCKQKKIL